MLTTEAWGYQSTSHIVRASRTMRKECLMDAVDSTQCLASTRDVSKEPFPTYLPCLHVTPHPTKKSYLSQMRPQKRKMMD